MIIMARRRTRRGTDIKGRADALLTAVLRSREKDFTTMTGAEQEIVNGAANFRELNKYFNNAAARIVKESNDWLQKQELLRFLCTLDRDHWDSGIALAEWCAMSDVGFDSGILTRIMKEADMEKVPPEWIAAAQLKDKTEDASKQESRRSGLGLDAAMLGDPTPSPDRRPNNDFRINRGLI